MESLTPPRVLLGVAGGIAAYKSAELLRRLTETGHSVRVLPTASALEFVGAATFEALSGQPVHTGVFVDVPSVSPKWLGTLAIWRGDWAAAEEAIEEIRDHPGIVLERARQ